MSITAADVERTARRAMVLAGEIRRSYSHMQSRRSSGFDPIHTEHVLAWHANADFSAVAEALRQAVSALEEMDAALDGAYEQGDLLAAAAGEQTA